MPKSTIRDGWGILLNAQNHLENTPSTSVANAKALGDAEILIQNVRLANFETFSHEWALNRAVVVAGE